MPALVGSTHDLMSQTSMTSANQEVGPETAETASVFSLLPFLFNAT